MTKLKARIFHFLDVETQLTTTKLTQHVEAHIMNDSETLPLWTAYVWYEQRLLLCLKLC